MYHTDNGEEEKKKGKHKTFSVSSCQTKTIVSDENKSICGLIASRIKQQVGKSYIIVGECSQYETDDDMFDRNATRYKSFPTAINCPPATYEKHRNT